MDAENPYAGIVSAVQELHLPPWGTAMVLCFVVAVGFGMRPAVGLLISMVSRRRREIQANTHLLTADNMKKALDLAASADERAKDAVRTARQAMAGLTSCQANHALCEERLRLSRNKLLDIIHSKHPLEIDPPDAMWERIDKEAERAVRDAHAAAAQPSLDF